MNKKIVNKVSIYYTNKLQTFGPTYRGVDWNSKESQVLRFAQLLNIIPTKKNKISLLDYGCGFGSLYTWVKVRYPEIKYDGYDISAAMISEAKKIHDSKHVSWHTDLPSIPYDFVIASGIFNVKLDLSIPEWEKYVLETLNTINDLSLSGFSFNMLTKYSDTGLMKDNLYYADPLYFFDLCKNKFSKFVSLIHDYPLYEFTILVKKTN